MDYFAQVVHKLWIKGGILMHSIHKPLFDKVFCRPQAVEMTLFTPVIGDLTTEYLGKFNFFHTCPKSYPQVMHMVWVNYTHVIPQLFGIFAGMSQPFKFKWPLDDKFQVLNFSRTTQRFEKKFTRLNRLQ